MTCEAPPTDRNFDHHAAPARTYKCPIVHTRFPTHPRDAANIATILACYLNDLMFTLSGHPTYIKLTRTKTPTGTIVSPMAFHQWIDRRGSTKHAVLLS